MKGRSAQTIEPAERVYGTLAVPGDKSISHRALLVAAVAEGDTAIDGLSPAADVASTLTALGALGVGTSSANSQVQEKIEGSKVSTHARDFQIVVRGQGWEALRDPEGPIDVGNSGSTIRMLLGILAGAPVTSVLIGDESIQRRPMARVVEPLRAMGAEIEGRDGGAFAPLRVRGGPLEGMDHVLEIASSQVKTALLFAGLRASGTTSVSEPGPSRDHTERMLGYLGVPIDGSPGHLVVKSTKIQGDRSLSVPGDLSSAAFLLVAAATLPGSAVTVTDVGVNPTRDGILRILREYGARVLITDAGEVSGEPVATVTVEAGERRPVEVAGTTTVLAIDELPLVAVLGAFAEGETVVRDAQELRVKESDRIEAITTGLRRMGTEVVPTSDGLVVRGPTRLRGATVSSEGDHRIAMALAVAALGASEPTTIEGWEAVGVSYPGFEADLARVAVR